MTKFGTLTQVMQKHISGVRHAPLLRGTSICQIFLDQFLHPNGLTYGDKIWYGNVWGVACSSGGQTRPRPKGTGPKRPQINFFGDQPTYYQTGWPTAIKYGTLTHVRVWHVSRWSATPPHLTGVRPSIPKFSWDPQSMAERFDLERWRNVVW